jgi:predicted AAA+ superfamily ATPase
MRTDLEGRIRRSIKSNPVTALFGPRQCGKTTIARRIVKSNALEYFDLEDPVDLRRLDEPMTALSALRGMVVIDEIHRRPDLFPILRVLADRRPLRTKFLILGSASPDLLRQGSETLAGRIGLIEMGGFDLSEAGTERFRRLWSRGGFPRSFLASNDQVSLNWRENFIRTFLERDLREFGIETPPAALRRLWSMLAHYHGQVWNASEIARSLGEAHTTVKRHLDLLTGALMIRQLQPWYQNLGKRQVKAPKIYVRDSGLLHVLLGLRSFRELEGHPKVGASWEGFVVETAARLAGDANVFFWATQAGAELDLLVHVGNRRIGIEIKYSDAPATTKSMRIAIGDLQLKRLYIVYPGAKTYDLDRAIKVIPITSFPAELSASLKRRP